MKKEKLFLSNKDMPKEVMDKEVFPGFYVTNPHIPFYFFAPISIALLALSFFYIHLSILQMILSFGCAFLFWPPFEYFMHRNLFHWEPKSEFGKKFIYTIHQGHHDYPNDSKLMLVGPIVSIPAFILIWGISFLIAGHYAHPFMAGLGTCYMFYDWLHYASHHYNFKNGLFQKLKKHHMRHHYEDNDKNFAFTTLIWDVILKTLIRDKK